MTSAELTSTRVIAAPAAQVWDYLTDWSRQGEWIPLTRVELVEGEGTAAGHRVSAFTGVGPVGFTDPITITRWEPPRRLELLHTGKVVRGGASVVITDDAPGSVLLWWQERIDIPGGAVGALGWRLGRPVASRLLDLSLRTLARKVEARS